VVENLFWLERYVERTEARARLLRVIGNLLINESDDSLDQIIGPFREQVEPAETSDPDPAGPSAKSAIGFAQAGQLTLAAALDVGRDPDRRHRSECNRPACSHQPRRCRGDRGSSVRLALWAGEELQNVPANQFLTITEGADSQGSMSKWRFGGSLPVRSHGYDKESR
jgi:hypothetical protein